MTDATHGQASAGQAASVDVNELPVTPAAARLYRLCSAWERAAFMLPAMFGQQDPSAKALRDCGDQLRDTVNDLRRDGDL